jgi:hypothetical protein
MSREGELRRHVRSTQSARVQVVWKDRQGVDRLSSGTIVDVSESGVRIELSDPLEKHSYVTLHSASLGLQGSASVRTCTRKGVKYFVGLELTGGLKWKPKT